MLSVGLSARCRQSLLIESQTGKDVVMMQTNSQTVSSLRREAKAKGLFLPVCDSAAALESTVELHGYTVANRRSHQLPLTFDAKGGMPSAATKARYTAAAKAGFGLLWSEPMAVCEEGKRHADQLTLTEATLPAIREMVQAMKQANNAQPSLLIAVLDHGGRYAVDPAPVERCPVRDAALGYTAPLAEDMTLRRLIVTVGEAARLAEAAGFDGIALNAEMQSLFGESLAAFSRDGVFGGDFEDRTRFLRDCYTAAKLTTEKAFLCIRLHLCDMIPQPHGWGMAFEDFDAPDMSEPALLLQILHELYDVTLVACEMAPAAHDDAVLAMSQGCTCNAMVDSALQQQVHLVVPPCKELPHLAANVGAAMVDEAFASFAAL